MTIEYAYQIFAALVVILLGFSASKLAQGNINYWKVSSVIVILSVVAGSVNYYLLKSSIFNEYFSEGREVIGHFEETFDTAPEGGNNKRAFVHIHYDGNQIVVSGQSYVLTDDNIIVRDGFFESIRSTYNSKTGELHYTFIGESSGFHFGAENAREGLINFKILPNGVCDYAKGHFETSVPNKRVGFKLSRISENNDSYSLKEGCLDNSETEGKILFNKESTHQKKKKESSSSRIDKDNPEYQFSIPVLVNVDTIEKTKFVDTTSNDAVVSNDAIREKKKEKETAVGRK